MTIPVEPIFFHPRFEEKLWGGTRLHTVLGKAVAEGVQIGESWEISAVENKETFVASGRLKGQTLSSLYKKWPYEILGTDASKYGFFPLLIKFIDAQERLSIQVHPDDRSAMMKYGEPFGKTECWYIVEAGKNARISLGLKQTIKRNELREVIATGQIEQLLNTVEVKKGEVYFIPAGTVHAILGDLVLYEVQQNSNTTFRLYDWKRTDADGKPRPLHVDEAVSVTYHKSGRNYRIDPLEVGGYECRRIFRAVCRYFALEEFIIGPTDAFTLPKKKSCRILTFLEGGADIVWNGGKRSMAAGVTVLIPAALEICYVQVKERCRFLMTTVPDIESEIEKPLREAGFLSEAIGSLIWN